MARTGWGEMGYQITTGSDDPNKVISKNRWNLPLGKGSGILGFAAQSVASALTITPSKSVVVLSGSTEVTKFLTGDSEEYDILYVFKASGATCTLTNTTGTPNADGQIVGLGSASTIALSETVPKIFIRKSNGSHQLWVEYGGSGTAAASELTGTTLASNVITSSLTTVGALNAGSITSGFGNINIGSSNFTSTGTVTCDVTGDLTGNADTATKATNVTVADESADTSCNVLFTTAATGDLPPKTGTNLTFNSNTGILTATGFTGDLTGDVTGDVSGSSGSCTGNAATATSATNATNSTNIITVDESTDTSCNVLFVADAAATQQAKTGTNLTFNSNTGILTATGFAGALTGNVTGNADTVTTNANLTGEVTSTGNATVIADDKVDEANLKVDNSPTNDYVLTAKSSAAGGLTWAAAASGSDTPWTEVHNFAGYYYDMTVQTKPANPSANNARFYVKEIDSNNDGLFCIMRKNGSDTIEVQLA